MKATLKPLIGLESLGEQWRNLEQRVPDASFFQSWTWVGSWLQALPDAACVRVLTIENDDAVVGLGLLGARTLRRHCVLPVRGLFLSETGDPALDTLTVEHNGLLLDSATTDAAIPVAVAALLAAEPWDELKIAGVETSVCERYRAAFPMRGCRLLVRNAKPYFTIALDRLRAEGRRFPDSLSSNTRSQVRRSMREYGKRGPLVLRLASDEAEAFALLDRLSELHQAYWRGRGMPGAFATDFASEFHRRLISAGLSRGEIQLAEVASGSQTIGYLYNFAYRGRVLNYQSALHYGTDSKLKPGLVAHALLVEENLRRGARVYDLLMGNQRYKKSLATDEGTMCELVIQRDRWRFRIEDLARTAHGALRRQRGEAARSGD